MEQQSGIDKQEDRLSMEEGDQDILYENAVASRGGEVHSTSSSSENDKEENDEYEALMENLIRSTRAVYASQVDRTKHLVFGSKIIPETSLYFKTIRRWLLTYKATPKQGKRKIVRRVVRDLVESGCRFYQPPTEKKYVSILLPVPDVKKIESRVIRDLQAMIRAEAAGTEDPQVEEQSQDNMEADKVTLGHSFITYNKNSKMINPEEKGAEEEEYNMTLHNAIAIGAASTPESFRPILNKPPPVQHVDIPKLAACHSDSMLRGSTSHHHVSEGDDVSSIHEVSTETGGGPCSSRPSPLLNHRSEQDPPGGRGEEDHVSADEVANATVAAIEQELLDPSTPPLFNRLESWSRRHLAIDNQEDEVDEEENVQKRKGREKSIVPEGEGNPNPEGKQNLELIHVDAFNQDNRDGKGVLVPADSSGHKAVKAGDAASESGAGSQENASVASLNSSNTRGVGSNKGGRRNTNNNYKPSPARPNHSRFLLPRPAVRVVAPRANATGGVVPPRPPFPQDWGIQAGNPAPNLVAREQGSNPALSPAYDSSSPTRRTKTTARRSSSRSVGSSGSKRGKSTKATPSPQEERQLAQALAELMPPRKRVAPQDPCLAPAMNGAATLADPASMLMTESIATMQPPKPAKRARRVSAGAPPKKRAPQATSTTTSARRSSAPTAVALMESPNNGLGFSGVNLPSSSLFGLATWAGCSLSDHGDKLLNKVVGEMMARLQAVEQRMLVMESQNRRLRQRLIDLEEEEELRGAAAVHHASAVAASYVRPNNKGIDEHYCGTASVGEGEEDESTLIGPDTMLW